MKEQNEHHKIEAIFKAFAKAIKVAVKRDNEKNDFTIYKRNAIMKIAIIDYRSRKYSNIQFALERLGFEGILTNDIKAIQSG